ncbi:hypothetical protein RHMOL_Rhmol06G0169300 [Rhododendron molle]|uniref:Uncharacterized protein n=1 Tax=Rhododendron molle TaxID=49168 RepID=A0ACC0ND21_RHOML|nr:hypothetical protein RHMOL_Rhmol06G0169300 [Rhododendron molle]
MPKDSNKPVVLYRLQRHCISFVMTSSSGPQHDAGGVPVMFIYSKQGTSFSAHNGVRASATLAPSATIIIGTTAAAKIITAGSWEKPIAGFLVLCFSLRIRACVHVFMCFPLTVLVSLSTCFPLY